MEHCSLPGLSLYIPAHVLSKLLDLQRSGREFRDLEDLDDEDLTVPIGAGSDRLRMQLSSRHVARFTLPESLALAVRRGMQQSMPVSKELLHGQLKACVQGQHEGSQAYCNIECPNRCGGVDLSAILLRFFPNVFPPPM